MISIDSDVLSLIHDIVGGFFFERNILNLVPELMETNSMFIIVYCFFLNRNRFSMSATSLLFFLIFTTSGIIPD